MMNAAEYSTRSNARRAARAAGLDPDAVQQTASGKWSLPAQTNFVSFDADNSISQGPGPDPRLEPTSGATPDPLTLPEELRVDNRRPLTPEQQARVDAAMARSGAARQERTDPRKPKGLSWEEWDAHQAAEASSRREASLERVAELRAKRPPKAKRLPKPRREDAYQPADVIRVLSKKNPCRPGTAAHAVFEKYRDGMSVAQFTKAAASVCPGRLRPVDYLIYDSKKGRISIAAVSGKQ